MKIITYNCPIKLYQNKEVNGAYLAAIIINAFISIVSFITSTIKNR